MGTNLKEALWARVRVGGQGQWGWIRLTLGPSPALPAPSFCKDRAH